MQLPELSYWHSMNPTADPSNGKEVISYDHIIRMPHVITSSNLLPKWSLPPLGWVKLNSDGSMCEEGRAEAGMVLRDAQGVIIFSSCR